jgi:hypothetical protein
VVRNHAFRRFACPAKETPARAASAEPAEQTRSAKWDAPSAMCPLPRTTSIEAHPESTRSHVFYLHCKLNVIECMQCTLVRRTGWKVHWCWFLGTTSGRFAPC